MRPLRGLSLCSAALLSACAGSSPTPGPTPSAPGSITLAAPAGDAWYRGAVFYEVFVRSFQDSNGDGVGDLPGLISRLDYLNDGNPATTDDLGVDALWLMPVFASPSYHGYDVTDYERIQTAYGSLEDLQRLCDEAHRRGMRVILDFVINHTSSSHPWFVDSASSAQSAKRDWYQWRGNNPAWAQPWDIYSQTNTWHQQNSGWYYGVFWGGMPDLNMQTPAVREEFKRLATLWLQRGVDGFRLDAARYLIETGGGAGQADTPETHAFWKEFSAHVRSVKPDAVLVGEAWSETPSVGKYYGSTATVPGGDELPLNFNFPMSARVLEGINAGNGGGVAAKLLEMKNNYPAGVADAPFLTNHDQVRLATQFANDGAKLGLAAAVLLTLPGAPFLYYGEEVGLGNGNANNDESKRTPMPWSGAAGAGFTTGSPWYAFSSGRETANVEAQRSNPGSLLSRYRSLIHARQGSEALRNGGLRLFTATTGMSRTLAFVRTLDDEQVLVVHNFSTSQESVGPFDVEATTAEPLFVDPGVTQLSGGTGAWKASIPARSTGIWRLR
ncbi:alpha-amylase [Corallococcus sp. AB004]|uniref:alpha-amylase family glycosyl hydrolase n=1 Tax=Corallococcus TaxID=83461 RepID=UPI000EA099A6|nr:MULTISPECIES: alpha-amylase family glycosyl hydrolase [Corallococcus]RKI46161.1 alpha-amylase [Corallococcus sp. AB004]NPC74591.1 alpha-amylase [Corallococcus exiguus]NPD24383.1 alpha-amylase [Corallococcus exiguus]NRD47673.1 alpha-amylase [Corallococcus exiguus]RKI03621.1 alpha-amylase [Corallococcus sp. AB038B]